MQRIQWTYCRARSAALGLIVASCGGNLALASPVFSTIPPDIQLYDTTLEMDASFKEAFRFVNYVRWPSAEEIREHESQDVTERMWRWALDYLQGWLSPQFIPPDVRKRTVFLKAVREGSDLVTARWVCHGTRLQLVLGRDKVLLIAPETRVPVTDVREHVLQTIGSCLNQHPQVYPVKAADVSVRIPDAGRGWHGLAVFRLDGFERTLSWWSDGSAVAFLWKELPEARILGLPPPPPNLRGREREEWKRQKRKEVERRYYQEFSIEKAVYPFGRHENERPSGTGGPRATDSVERFSGTSAEHTPEDTINAVSKPHTALAEHAVENPTVEPASSDAPSPTATRHEPQGLASSGGSIWTYLVLGIVGVLIVGGGAAVTVALARRRSMREDRER